MIRGIDFQLRQAERAAAGLIERYGITTPGQIRLEDIAFDNKVRIVDGRLSRAAASLVVAGDSATVRVPRDQHPTRRRFSIAHEFGHFFLKHVHSVQKICSGEDMLSWYGGDQETEANFFASELLLPKALIKKRCDVRTVNFAPIIQLAADFSVSLTAAAIKFVRHCPEACAVVFSKEDRIRWSYHSEEWHPPLENGSPLDRWSLAHDFFAGKELPAEPEEVRASAWFDHPFIEEVVEHSIASPEFGFVLTILWITPDRAADSAGDLTDTVAGFARLLF